jgi:hypothetical protein
MNDAFSFKTDTYLLMLDPRRGPLCYQKCVLPILGIIDTNYNQFEILVERINGSVYLTTGFNAIRDFYDIRMGGWVLMVFSGLSQFGINVINRLGLVVTPPPIRFEIAKPLAPNFVYQNVPITTELLTFRHKGFSFQLNTDVKLSKYDVTSGFLVRWPFTVSICRINGAFVLIERN